MRPQKPLQSELCCFASAIESGSLYMGGQEKIWEYIWGVEIRTCWLSVDWKGKWYLGAGKSYLGGPRGLEIRISVVFSNRGVENRF